MGIRGLVVCQFDVVGCVEVPARFEDGPIDVDVGAAEVVDRDAGVENGSNLCNVERGVGGISHGDKFFDYEWVTVGRVEMDDGAGRGGAVRQDVRDDPFEVATG